MAAAFSSRRRAWLVPGIGTTNGFCAKSHVHIKLGGLGMRMFGFTHHLGELAPSPVARLLGLLAAQSGVPQCNL